MPKAHRELSTILASQIIPMFFAGLESFYKNAGLNETHFNLNVSEFTKQVCKNVKHGQKHSGSL